MEEASQREQLLRRIHSLEAKITDNISTIKNELHETVTFDGKKRLEGDSLRRVIKLSSCVHRCTLYPQDAMRLP